MIAAVKKMYRDIAIDEKRITRTEFSIFGYLKINREIQHKRVIMEPEELEVMLKRIKSKYCRDSDIDELERATLRIYGLYQTINHCTGAGFKEILGSRREEIQPMPTESKEDQRINRLSSFLLKMLKLETADKSFICRHSA